MNPSRSHPFPLPPMAPSYFRSDQVFESMIKHYVNIDDANLLRFSALLYTKYFQTGVCLLVPPLRIAAAGLRCHDQSSSPNKAAAGDVATAIAPGIGGPDDTEN